MSRTSLPAAIPFRRLLLLAGCALAIPAAAASGGTPGKLTREVWKDIPGSGVWHLRNSEKFRAKPDLAELIDGFELPSNWADSFGQRIRGYLLPRVSGQYVFLVSGDDNCVLRLSPDDNKFHARRIARISGLGTGHREDYSAPEQWGKFPSQKSKPVRLEAGKKYFIEVLHKEGKGADHLEVAWMPEGAETPEPIPAALFESYASDPYDVDADELPDDWELARGINCRDNGCRDGRPALRAEPSATRTATACPTGRNSAPDPTP